MPKVLTEEQLAKRAKKAKMKALDEKDARVTRLYKERCPGAIVNVLDISKIFKVGYQAIDEGADDQVVGDRIHEYVETIRQK